MGVRVLLEELGVEYSLIQTSIDRRDPPDEALLALNPNGWIPVLCWDDQSIYECAAIFTFLCERHPAPGLAPGVGDPARGEFLQWLVFFSSSLQNAFQMTYYPDRFCAAKADYASVQARSVSRLRELWKVVDDALVDRTWLLGDRFSAVDIYLYMLTTWLSPRHSHPTVDEFCGIQRVVDAVAERRSVQVVRKSGGMTRPVRVSGAHRRV